jgi:hypothetical protein
MKRFYKRLGLGYLLFFVSILYGMYITLYGSPSSMSVTENIIFLFPISILLVLLAKSK